MSPTELTIASGESLQKHEILLDRRILCRSWGMEENIPRRNAVKGIGMQRMLEHALKIIPGEKSISQIKNSLNRTHSDWHNFWYVHQNNIQLKQNRHDNWISFCKGDLIYKKNICAIGTSKLFYNHPVMGTIQTHFLSLMGYLAKKEVVFPMNNLSLRPDIVQVNKGVLTVWESKNKEISGLSAGDVRRQIIYPILLRENGFTVREFNVIVNGYFTDGQRNYLKRAGYIYDVQVYPVPLASFLRNTIGHGLKCSCSYDGKRWHYQICSEPSGYSNIYILTGEEPKGR